MGEGQLMPLIRISSAILLSSLLSLSLLLYGEYAKYTSESAKSSSPSSAAVREEEEGGGRTRYAVV